MACSMCSEAWRGHDCVVRVAYTLEQCWHECRAAPVSLRCASPRRWLARRRPPDRRCRATLAPVPIEPWTPAIPIAHLPVGGAVAVRAVAAIASGRRSSVRPARSTWHTRRRLIPCATDAPLVVTLHDLAFLHDPTQFTRRRQQHLPAQPRPHPAPRGSRAVQQPGDDGRLRCSPESTPIACGSCRSVSRSTKADADEIARVASLYRLPERYLLFVGTVEPRKNLRGLAEAVSLLAEPLPLIVAGAEGWGDVDIAARRRHPVHRLRAGLRPRRSVRRSRRVLLPERARGLRIAGARGDGAGHAGGDQSRHGDRGDSGRCGCARRSAGPGRHRPRHRRGGRATRDVGHMASPARIGQLGRRRRG